jgi:hypothetical protein
MTCRLDACSQGKRQCPCPDICGDHQQPETDWKWQTLVFFAILFAVSLFTVLWATA